MYHEAVIEDGEPDLVDVDNGYMYNTVYSSVSPSTCVSGAFTIQRVHWLVNDRASRATCMPLMQGYPGVMVASRGPSRIEAALDAKTSIFLWVHDPPVRK